MRSKFLLGTATLVASIAVASAQQPMKGGQGDGAAQGGAAEQRSQSPQAQPVQRGQDSQPQRGKRDQTTGQGQQGQQRDQGQTQQRQESPQQGQQSPQREQGQQGQQRDQGQTQQRQESPRQGQQSPQREQGQQKGQQGQQQGQAGGGNVSLTTDQRTKIKQTVLTSGAPRASNVNFKISVGTTVPERVRVVAVPDVLVEIRPEWRGYMYFVVGQRIIIVDRNNRIVAVLVV